MHGQQNIKKSCFLRLVLGETVHTELADQPFEFDIDSTTSTKY